MEFQTEPFSAAAPPFSGAASAGGGARRRASGEIDQLLNVIAPGSAATASVIGNFRQVAKEGDLRMHPIVGRLVDKETLEKVGAKQG